jgi:hypothetical protein
MKSNVLRAQLDRIRSLIRRTKAVPDLELQAHLGRYLCVLVAGFAENAISEVYGDYCEGRASPPVKNYAISQLERVQNPKAQRFLEVARAFSPAWSAELAAFLELDGRKEAIDSIMSNRHLIAHGRMPTITVVRVDGYLDRVVAVIEFIEAQCSRTGPSSTP